MPEIPEYLSVLNPEQRKAVEHFGGPLLILAGAGSGKTRVITTKIAWLIDTMGMSPRSILAVTFTNKAAQEMKERVLSLVPGAGDVMIRTFHSFGAWFLRRNAELAGLARNFTIYDDEDSVSLLKGAHGDDDRAEIKRLAFQISRVKDLGISEEDGDLTIAAAGCPPEVFRAYQGALKACGNVDFGDLILLPIRMLRSIPEVRERTLQRFKVVLVDEYQDTNIAQYQLLKELHGPDTYICVVGDDDQSIYRFRGAEVGNILSFPETFPGTTIVRLERNYRSTSAILQVASTVVANNNGRLGKTLWTETKGGEPVTVACCADQDEEARFCARIAEDGFPGTTAILYRMNAQSRAFEELFRREKVPYRLVGSVSFYAREEVKDAIAYLALLANPRDSVAFGRVINKPARGIGRASVEKILEEWRGSGGTLIDACGRAASSLPAKARAGVNELAALYKDLSERAASTPLAELARYAISKTGLYSSFKTRDDSDGTDKAKNLEELVNAMAQYGSGPEALTQFLENSALVSAVDQEKGDAAGALTLITVHNTKGLEFDRVIVTGLEEGIFPHQSSTASVDELEEERRLFYVACTRARERLILTWCLDRRVFGRTASMEPSRFLDEIPSEMVRRIGEEDAEEDDGFPLGCGVFHDDYGPGVVERKWYNAGNLLVQVRFRTGKVAKFLPKYNRLERVSGDE